MSELAMHGERGRFRLPEASPGTDARILVSGGLLGAVIPLPTTYGTTGTAAGIARLLEEEPNLLPTIWLDTGDLSVGGPRAPFGGRAVAGSGPLPIAAAAAGDQELAGGPDGLREFAGALGVPLLCADREVGLPGYVLIETRRGAIGVVGVSHPAADRLSPAPTVWPDWRERVADHAVTLRRMGARWVVALVHEGVTWSTRVDRPTQVRTWLEPLRVASNGWAFRFDAILCGHTLAGWVGRIRGKPAGQPSAFGTDVIAVDLPRGKAMAQVHRPVRVPPLRPCSASRAVRRLDQAGDTVIGSLSHEWSTRPGAVHYLPDLVAEAMRGGCGADAALVPAGQVVTQAPVDGVAAALRAGPVTELDVLRLCPDDRDGVALVELGEGEFERLQLLHDAGALATNRRGDYEWWNVVRARAGVAEAGRAVRTLAVVPSAVPLISSWLSRHVDVELAATGLRAALRARLGD